MMFLLILKLKLIIDLYHFLMILKNLVADCFFCLFLFGLFLLVLYCLKNGLLIIFIVIIIVEIIVIITFIIVIIIFFIK